MDITLPNNPGFEITGENLQLLGGHIQGAVQGHFGIGPHVADNDSPLALFAFALLALTAMSKLRVWS